MGGVVEGGGATAHPTMSWPMCGYITSRDLGTFNGPARDAASETHAVLPGRSFELDNVVVRRSTALRAQVHRSPRLISRDVYEAN
jgi:hypothetical protein